MSEQEGDDESSVAGEAGMGQDGALVGRSSEVGVIMSILFAP